jgi:phage/plasmid-like protein (TIGR03299 family)
MAHGINDLIDEGITVGRNWHMRPSYRILEDGSSITPDQVREVMPTYIVADPVYNWLNPATGEVEQRPMDSKRVLVHEKFGHVVGLGGADSYRENQPSEWAPIVAQIANDHGFRVVSTGTLQDGAKTFVSVLLDGFEMQWGTDEIALPFLNFGDAVNGTSRWTMASAVNRVVCNNTFQAYITGVRGATRISHTTTGPDKVADVLAALEAGIREQKLITEAIERLLNETHTEAQFNAMLKHNDMLGARPTDEGNSQTRWDNTFDEMTRAYDHETNREIRGTAYGSIQAVQFAEQHTLSVRGTDRQSRHAERLLFTGQDKTNIASRLVMADCGLQLVGSGLN